MCSGAVPCSGVRRARSVQEAGAGGGQCVLGLPVATMREDSKHGAGAGGGEAGAGAADGDVVLHSHVRLWEDCWKGQSRFHLNYLDGLTIT